MGACAAVPGDASVARGRLMSPWASSHALRRSLGSSVGVLVPLSCSLCAFFSIVFFAWRGYVSPFSSVCYLRFIPGCSRVLLAWLGMCAVGSSSSCCAAITSLLLCAGCLLVSSRLLHCSMYVFSVGCCVVGFSRCSLSVVVCKEQ
jgi:hypothetical protein